MSGQPINRILPLLNRVKKTGMATWLASCPTGLHRHGDRSRGLSIRELDDGTILLHCFAGCGADLVLRTLDLEMGDLFPGEFDPSNQRPKVPPIPWGDAFEAIEEDLIVAGIALRSGIRPEDAETVARHVESLNEQIGRLRNGRHY